MTGILETIDRATNGLCPCGADPREGSAYCSADCEPTHIAGDTDTSGPGTYGAQSTAMRWRPDLITAHDDSDLELVCADIPRGDYNGTMYRRHSTGAIHLRLDDGHRWVGCDVPDGDTSPGTVVDRWEALERELGNQRHAVPGEPAFRCPCGCDSPEAEQWLTALTARHPAIRADHRAEIPVGERYCVHCSTHATPLPGRRAAPFNPVDIYSWGETLPIRVSSDDTEECDLCGNCRHPFPGPPLQTGRFALGAYLRHGTRIAIIHGHARTETDARQRRDEAEHRLLADYARDNPDRPDVADWIRACDQAAVRRNNIWWQWRVADILAARFAPAPSLFRITGT